MVKNPPTIQETWVRSLGWEDLLEEGRHHEAMVCEHVIGVRKPTGRKRRSGPDDDLPAGF